MRKQSSMFKTKEQDKNSQRNFNEIETNNLLDEEFKAMVINILTKLKKTMDGASLVAQWLRVCLLMQGTRVRALVWEDPACRGAAGPVGHNC